jgi:hypothetical protein
VHDQRLRPMNIGPQTRCSGDRTTHKVQSPVTCGRAPSHGRARRARGRDALQPRALHPLPPSGVLARVRPVPASAIHAPAPRRVRAPDRGRAALALPGATRARQKAPRRPAARRHVPRGAEPPAGRWLALPAAAPRFGHALAPGAPLLLATRLERGLRAQFRVRLPALGSGLQSLLAGRCAARLLVCRSRARSRRTTPLQCWPRRPLQPRSSAISKCCLTLRSPPATQVAMPSSS